MKETSTDLHDKSGSPLLPKGRLPTRKEMDAWAASPAGQEWEAQLQRAAKRLKGRLSGSPFFAARAKAVAERDGSDDAYWLALAASAPNA